MSSTIAPARAGLFAALNAAALDPVSPLYQVEIAFGAVDPPEPQELVVVLGVTNPIESAAFLGPTSKLHREESYRLVVAVKSHDPTATTDPAGQTSALTVDARGWELAEGVRDAVTADITLGGIVRTALPVSQAAPNGVFVPFNDDGVRMPGFMIRVDVEIECNART